MATSNSEQSRLTRVQGPALPVIALASEPEPTVEVSELHRVRGPALPTVTLRSEPIPPAAVTILELPLVSGQRGEVAFATLNSVIQKVNEIEALCGRAGVWVDGTRSGVREGKIEIVLAPNDPTDAVNTCKRVAQMLFSAAPGVTVKVIEADRPDTPVFELAA